MLVQNIFVFVINNYIIVIFSLQNNLNYFYLILILIFHNFGHLYYILLQNKFYHILLSCYLIYFVLIYDKFYITLFSITLQILYLFNIKSLACFKAKIFFSVIGLFIIVFIFSIQLSSFIFTS